MARSRKGPDVEDLRITGVSRILRGLLFFVVLKDENMKNSGMSGGKRKGREKERGYFGYLDDARGEHSVWNLRGCHLEGGFIDSD